MLFISDTNILSSLAAADALSFLLCLFPNTIIYIPPAVHQELQIGLERGKTYLNLVLQRIKTGDIQVIDLLEQEQKSIDNLPKKLNRGECEAIALAQNRQAALLSNDKRAIRYCQQQYIEIIDLSDLLRLFWTVGVLKCVSRLSEWRK